MKALGQILLVLVILYVTSYIVLRSKWTHTWDKDGKAYMHFPVSSSWLQAVFGPVCMIDEKLSGLHFRVGPYPGTETDTEAKAATLPFVPENDPGNRPQLPASPAPVK